MTRGRLIAAAVVVALVAGVVWVLATPSRKHASAIFSQAVQLFPGDKVRVLGVDVGRITAIAQVPQGVRVDFDYDASAPVPADASAVIMSPTLVTGRFVQLTPARVSGPRLADDAVIGLDRTRTPVEFDQIKQQLQELSTALGPDGVNADGALSRTLTTTARNLAGNGGDIHKSVDQLARAVGALSDGREDLFGTVRNLQTLVTALRGADSQVAGFADQLDKFSGTLADSSDDLGKALDVIDSSVDRIGSFVRDTRDPLSDDLKALSKVAGTLKDNRQVLADLLQVAPTGVSNFQNIYDPFSGSITGAFALTQFQDPTTSVCSLLFGVPSGGDACQTVFGGLLKSAGIAYPPVALDTLQRNGSKNAITQDQTKRPDPHPHVHPPYDPGVTPPRPLHGTGARPYFGSTGPDGSARDGSARGLASLLVPTGGGR